jgi:hypothetical protein
MRAILKEAGLKLREGDVVDQRLSDIRQMYEPYVYSLSNYLHIKVPPWIPAPKALDNWQTSTWGRSTGFQIDGPSEKIEDDHF